MRAFIRTLINLGLIVAAVAVDLRVAALKAYQHSSHDGRIVMLVAPVAAAFVIACIVLRLIPSRAQMKKRQQGQRPASAYAVNRGR